MVSTTFTYPSRLRRDNYVSVVDTIHVADAVADTDETYGAYAAAENNTFNNANGSINNANNRNNNANYWSGYPRKLCRNPFFHFRENIKKSIFYKNNILDITHHLRGATEFSWGQ